MRRSYGTGSVGRMSVERWGLYECRGQEDEGGGEDVGEGWHGESVLWSELGEV